MNSLDTDFGAENEVFNASLFGEDEKKDAMRFQVISERHLHSVAISRIEELLVESPDLESEQLKQKIDGILSDAGIKQDEWPKYHGYVEKYKNEATKAKDAFDELKTFFKSQSKRLEKASDQELATVIGKGVYSQFKRWENRKQGNMVYIDNSDEVECSLEQKEGYFLLRFSDSKHVNDLVEGESTIAEGAFYKDFPCEFITINGRYTFRMPLIVISGDTDSTMFTHERQHWLNQVIYDLPKLEPETEARETSNEDSKKIEKLKDEALAYIGEWEYSPQSCAQYIRLGYTHLLSAEEDVDPKSTRAILGEIEKELTEYHYYFHHKESRKVLINALLDVPYEKFPKYIRAIGECYNRLYNRSIPAFVRQPFDTHLDLDTNNDQGAVYPSAFRGVSHELAATKKELKIMITSVNKITDEKNSVFVNTFLIKKELEIPFSKEEQEFFELLKKYYDALARYRELHKKLCVNGIHAPSVESSPRVVFQNEKAPYGYRDQGVDMRTFYKDTEDAHGWPFELDELINSQQQEKQAQELRDAVLSALPLIPQELVQELYLRTGKADINELNNGHPQMKDFIEQIKHKTHFNNFDVYVQQPHILKGAYPRIEIIVSFQTIPGYPNVRREVVAHIFTK